MIWRTVACAVFFSAMALAGQMDLPRVLAQTGPSGGGSSNVTAAQMPALTGDCTTSAGTVATTCGKLGGVSVIAPPSGLLVGTTDTQTLTNKTLTGAIHNGGTIDNAVIGGTTPAAASVTTITHTGIEIAAGCMDFQAPTAGGTVSIAAGVCEEMIAPVGTLATLTVNLIAAPVNGQKLRVRFTQIITALTMGAGGSNAIVGNPAAAALGNVVDCVYRTSNTTWYC
jgi:hypothetical protein